MEKDQYKDDFIRKMVAMQAPVNTPDGFTKKVMEKIQHAADHKPESLLSPLAWGGIFAGLAALIITLFLVDIPFLNNFFSSTGIENLSFNIFNTGFYDSFVKFFKELNINAVGVVIGIAFVSLIFIERIVSRRRNTQRLIMF